MDRSETIESDRSNDRGKEGEKRQLDSFGEYSRKRLSFSKHDEVRKEAHGATLIGEEEKREKEKEKRNKKTAARQHRGDYEISAFRFRRGRAGMRRREDVE